MPELLPHTRELLFKLQRNDTRHVNQVLKISNARNIHGKQLRILFELQTRDTQNAKIVLRMIHN